MLGDFAVVDAEHVEPGCGVFLSLVHGIVHFAHERQGHVVAFRLNGNQAGERIGDGLRPSELGKNTP